MTWREQDNAAGFVAGYFKQWLAGEKKSLAVWIICIHNVAITAISIKHDEHQNPKLLFGITACLHQQLLLSAQTEALRNKDGLLELNILKKTYTQ